MYKYLALYALSIFIYLLLMTNYAAAANDGTTTASVFMWPIEENEFFILQNFGNKRLNFAGLHSGTDFGVYKFNVPVYCIANGWIEDFGSRHDFGNFIVIKHQLSNGDTVYSWYNHLAQPLTGSNKGDFVRIGTPIGIVGETGTAPSGVHLHFEIKKTPDIYGGYIGNLSNHCNPYEFIISQIANDKAYLNQCSDGTPINECSPIKPLHCIAGGHLVENSILCGCDKGVAQPAGTCSKTDNGIIIDNDDAEFQYSGAWERSTQVMGFYGKDYLIAQPWYGTATATWRPSISQGGNYKLYGWWRDRFSAKGGSFPYRVKHAVLTINHNGRQDKAFVDYTDFHMGWKYIGTFFFASGNSNTIELSNKSNPDGAVVADAFRLVPAMSSVILVNFFAKAEKDRIGIKWSTEAEIENTGFNVLRSESNNGEFVKTNKQLIPSRGSSAKSAQYSFVDETAIHSKLYFYKLECVPLKGNSTFLGPIYSVP